MIVVIHCALWLLKCNLKKLEDLVDLFKLESLHFDQGKTKTYIKNLRHISLDVDRIYMY